MKKIRNIVDFASNLVLIAIIFMVGAFAYFSPTISQNCSTVINGCVYAGNLNSNKVSLMINVYWGTEFIEPMLEIFENNKIKCTFFVGGTWVEQNKDLLKKIYNHGHEIASHGYSHKEHAKLSYDQNLTEMKKTHDLVFDCLGINMSLFAPPGGSYNKDTVKASEYMNYTTIMWTKDTIDWRDQNSSLIFSRATTNMSGGDLILMHPKEKTLEALPKIIDYAIKNNFVLTTVSDTIA